MSFWPPSGQYMLVSFFFWSYGIGDYAIPYKGTEQINIYHEVYFIYFLFFLQLEPISDASLFMPIQWNTLQPSIRGFQWHMYRYS